MAFTAGQKLRASDLNIALPTMAYVTSDVTVNNSITMVNATGLSIALEANAKYAWDGVIGYASNTTADIKFALNGPAGVTGWWGFYGVVGSSTVGSTAGYIEAYRPETFSDVGSQVVSGDNTFAMQCRPAGYVVTSTTPGTLQIRFAQSVANASNTTIAAGSWIRLVRLA